MKYAYLLLLVIPILSFSCYQPGIKGSGNVISEERNVGSFNRIELHGKGIIHLSQGPEQPIKIEAEDNILEILESNVKSGTLIIKPSRNLGRTKDIHVYATTPEIEGVGVYGAATLKADGKLKGKKLHLDVAGAGKLNADLEFEEVHTDISGAGEAHLSGSAGSHYFTVSGAGELHGYDFQTNMTEVNISGAGSAYVHASEELNSSISGAGKVRYKGSPATVDKYVSGAGSIKPQ